MYTLFLIFKKNITRCTGNSQKNHSLHPSPPQSGSVQVHPLPPLGKIARALSHREQKKMWSPLGRGALPETHYFWGSFSAKKATPRAARTSARNSPRRGPTFFLRANFSTPPPLPELGARVSMDSPLEGFSRAISGSTPNEAAADGHFFMERFSGGNNRFFGGAQPYIEKRFRRKKHLMWQTFKPRERPGFESRGIILKHLQNGQNKIKTRFSQ